MRRLSSSSSLLTPRARVTVLFKSVVSNHTYPFKQYAIVSRFKIIRPSRACAFRFPSSFCFVPFDSPASIDKACSPPLPTTLVCQPSQSDASIRRNYVGGNCNSFDILALLYCQAADICAQLAEARVSKIDDHADHGKLDKSVCRTCLPAVSSTDLNLVQTWRHIGVAR